MADAPTVRYVNTAAFLCEVGYLGFHNGSNTRGLLINVIVVPELQV